jgi:putative PIN family toxin of toxin-antitoxin system
MAARPRVVLDTNVVVSALRSRRGSAFRVLEATGSDRFDIALSVPLVLEYEAALLEQRTSEFTVTDIRAVLDYLCAVAHQQPVFFLWRPWLPDPKDDMVLEVAVAAGCHAVVTYNVGDFRGAERFGVRVWTPLNLLKTVGLL